MSALRLGVFLGLAAVCLSQYQGGFQSPFAMGRQPMGFSGFNPFVGRQPAPFVGYDAYFSGVQRRPVYAGYFGFDQTSSAGPNCGQNGIRDANGRCQCRFGYTGADCDGKPVEQAQAEAPGFICRQTQGSISADRERMARAESEGPIGQLKLEIEHLMSRAGGYQRGGPILTGPGLLDACPVVTSGEPMAPIYLKSDLVENGYIQCGEQQRCENKVCGACTLFNPSNGACDHPTSPGARSICNRAVPPQEKAGEWFLSAVQIARAVSAAPQNAAVGNVPFGANPIGFQTPNFG